MTTVYENPWFSVVKEGAYHYIKEKGSGQGAVVLVRSDKGFVFVAVDRPAQGKVLVEAPRGYAEEGESARQCAARELEEETGFRVDPASLVELGRVRPNSAILASSVSVFFVDVAAAAPLSSPDSEIEGLVVIPEGEIHSALCAGRVSDGFTLSALALYWSSIDSGQQGR